MDKQPRKNPAIEPRSSRKLQSNLITVKCESHHKLLADCLWNFFKAQREVDLFLLEEGGRTIAIHKMVADAFLSSAKLVEKVDSGGEAHIEDGRTDDVIDNVDHLIEFLYTGSLSVPKEQLPVLLDVAKQLDFTVLVDELQSTLEAQPDLRTPAVAKKRGPGRPPNKKYAKMKHTGPVSGSLAGRRIKKRVRLVEQEWETPVAKRPRGRPPNRKAGTQNNKFKKSVRKAGKKLGKGNSKKGCHRKEWGFPVEDPDADWEPSEAEDAGKSEAVPDTPKEIVFKCGHCSFTSLAKENAIRHIQTEHVRAKSTGADASADRTEEVADANSDNNGEEADKGEGAVEKLVASDAKMDDVSREADSAKKMTSEEASAAKKPTLKCPDCVFQTESEAGFRVHLADHDPSAAYFKCHRCDVPFATAEAFERHEALTHASTPSILKCPRCKYRPLKFQTYLEHLRAMHKIDERGEPIPEATTCPLCEEDCGTSSELAAHVEMHVADGVAVPAPSQLCRCNKCDFTCTDVREMKVHKRQHIYKCELCDFSSLYRGQVNQHNRRVHMRIRSFVCDTCGYAVFCRSQLAQHKLTHTGERPFICEVCGRSFADRSTLRRHVAGHLTGDHRPFACELCSFSTRRKDALGVHVRLIHKTDRTGRRMLRSPSAPPLRCRLCAYQSDLQADMNRHVREKHGPDVKAYACDQCEYAGRSSDVLKRHRRIHTGEKPFVCPMCAFAFRDYSTFTRHKRNHCKPDQEKSFTCPVCPDSFVHLRYLKSHVKSMHGMMDAVGKGDGRVKHETAEMILPHGEDETTRQEEGAAMILQVGADDSAMILQEDEDHGLVLKTEYEESGIIYHTDENGVVLQMDDGGLLLRAEDDGAGGVVYQADDQGRVILHTDVGDDQEDDGLAMVVDDDGGLAMCEVGEGGQEHIDVYEEVDVVQPVVQEEGEEEEERQEAEPKPELEMQVQIITDDTGVGLVHVLDGYV